MEAQLRPACVSWSLLWLISARLTSFPGDYKEELLNRSAREIFGDSWTICQSQSHTASIFDAFDDFGEKSTISRFHLNGCARHSHCSVLSCMIFGDSWLIDQRRSRRVGPGFGFREKSDDFPVSV